MDQDEGRVGTFLLAAVPDAPGALSDEELIGEVPLKAPDGSELDQAAYSNLRDVAVFLTDLREARHRRHHRCDGGGGVQTTTPPSPSPPPSIFAVDRECYEAALNEFASAQMERQGAGLTAKTDQEIAQGLLQVVFSHRTALRMAMAHAEQQRQQLQQLQQQQRQQQDDAVMSDSDGIEEATPPSPPCSTLGLFTKEDLCLWHSILCPGAPPSQRGRFRTGTTGGDEGPTGPELDGQFGALSLVMGRLHGRWRMATTEVASPPLHDGNEDATHTTAMMLFTYRAVAMAAIMMYGMVELKCFVDGNGRMARICANWILQRVLGLPFPISIIGNASHSLEYYRAKEATEESISVVQSPRTLGVFEVLTRLLLDRVARSVLECRGHIEGKARAAAEGGEARIARRVREQAGTGQCIICLEDRPNILTICCGQAVHVNCLAQWLRKADSCVACRTPLPAMYVRTAATALSSGIGEDDEDDEDGGGSTADPSDPRNDVWSTVLTNMLWDAAAASASSSDNETEDDYGVAFAAGVAARAAYRNGTRHLCCNGECPNLAAGECENGMCRRCCRTRERVIGNFHCYRHEGDAVYVEVEDDHGGYVVTDTRRPMGPSWRNGPWAPHPPAPPSRGGTAAVPPRQHRRRDGNSNSNSNRHGRSGGGSNNNSSSSSPNNNDDRRPAHCRQCGNLAAFGCCNQMCGRHCMSDGQNDCERHGTNRSLGY